MGELFDRVHIIEVELGSDGSLVKKESYRFPPSGPGADRQAEENEVSTIVQFCFPEETIPKPRSNNSSSSGLRKMMDNAKLLRHAVQQTFSFVLTETDGSKRYGYCRRLLKDGKHAECACVISLVPSMALFAQLLDIIIERRAAPNTAASSASALFTFLRAVLANPFPKPGDEITVRTFSASGGSEPDVYTLTRPRSETLADFVSVGGVFSRISVAVIVELWAALLCERRVLITSADPVRLSSTMNALSALMHPFSWQHVFIPILPKSLSGYVTAPMPFFIGCLDSTLDAVRSMGMPLEEIYLVSADTGAVSMRPGDVPPDFLPRQPAALLLNTLVALYQKYIKGQSESEIDASPVNGLIMRAFLRCLRSVFIGCQKFFKKEQPPGYKGPTKKMYFHADDFEKYVENGAPPFPEGAGKDAASFVRALKMSQVFEMYMCELEDAVAQGVNITTSSPLLNDTAKKVTTPLLIRSSKCFTLPDTPVSSVVCSVCNGSFAPREPCSCGPNGSLFHTKCYRCSKCDRLLEGSVCPQNTGQVVCDMCHFAESVTTSAPRSALASGAKIFSSLKKRILHASVGGIGSGSLLSSSSDMSYSQSIGAPYEEAELAPPSSDPAPKSLVRNAQKNFSDTTRRASSPTITNSPVGPAWRKSVAVKQTPSSSSSSVASSPKPIHMNKSSPSLSIKPAPTSSPNLSSSHSASGSASGSASASASSSLSSSSSSSAKLIMPPPRPVGPKPPVPAGPKPARKLPPIGSNRTGDRSSPSPSRKPPSSPGVTRSNSYSSSASSSSSAPTPPPRPAQKPTGSVPGYLRK